MRKSKMIRDLLKEIEVFCVDYKITESTLGTYACSNGKVIERIRSGHRIYLDTYEKLRDFMHANRCATKARQTAEDLLSNNLTELEALSERILNMDAISTQKI